MIALPAGLSEVFAALRFEGADRCALQQLGDSEWKHLLPICDRMQLTLPLAAACGEGSAPAWVLSRMQRAARDTSKRSEIVWNAYREIAQCLNREATEFVVLKGFTGEPEFIADARLRVQYDLDFFIPGEAARSAYDSIRRLGYAPVGALSDLPTDHLPVLVRPTGWIWQGDYFDPEIPVSVDVHFRLWDEETEQFPAPGWELFWNRRIFRHRGGVAVPALSAEDSLGYHCLHLLRHLLRGDLRFGHVYELGYFLHTTAGDDPFWARWQHTHLPELRCLQTICFELARVWFACMLPKTAAAEIAALPREAHYWLSHYAFAPVQAAVRPNKHELWLHLGLLANWAARRRVLARRLLPAVRMGPSGAVFVPEAERTLRVRMKHAAKLLRHRAGRVWHHARTLPEAIWHCLAWWWRFRDVNRSTKSRSNTDPA